jgi:KDO2-lipid IV(A) lauroyltransferase
MPLSVIHTIVPAISLFQLIASGNRRKITISELSSSGLIDKNKAFKILYRSFINQNNFQVKMCYLPNINSENVNDYFRVDGLQYLDEAMKIGKGTVLLNPHFGPFLLVMPALGHMGYKLNQVVLQGEPIIGRRKGLNRLIYDAKFDAIDRNLPANFINAANNKLAIRDVLTSLSENQIVLFASTGRGGKSWHEVSFLGRRATFNLMPFKVALKAGSALIPAFVIDSKPIAKVIIEKPLDVLEGETPEKMLEKYISVLSLFVKRYPEHFAFYLYDMHIQAWWDDHPFFSDYPVKIRQRKVEGNRVE